MSGKRERTGSTRSSRQGGWWARHKAWVAGLSRGQKIRYRLLQVLVVLIVIAIGVAAGLKAWMKLPEVPNVPVNSGEGSSSSGYDGAELPDVAKSGRKEGVYTFLLVGQDTAGGGNTDTMMLITFDTVNKTIDGMSLPRDTMINVDRKGSGHRLNAVYNYNKGSDPDTQVEKGIAALKKEVGKLTGITPDFYVMVQWEAVGEMVDALGGVYFDVPFDMDYDDPTPGQDLHIHLKEGYQKLDGEQAMGLIRWRHNNDYSVQYPTGDLGRIETQQDFLKAVAAECLKPATLLKAPALAEVFMQNVTTDLSLGNLLAFAQLAAGMDAEQNVNFVSLPVKSADYPGISMVLPVVDDLLEILNESFNPYLSDIQSSDLQVLVRNSDGSYSVTGGTLLDSSLSSPRGGSSSGSTSGGGTQSGGSGSETSEPSDNSSQEGSGSTSQPEVTDPTTPPDGSQTTDPEEPVTDPEQPPQGGGDGSQAGGDSSQSGGTDPGQPDQGGGTSGESGGGQSSSSGQGGESETVPTEPAGGELAA